MVFLGGPRQIGKTTLAQDLLSRPDQGYYNYDSPTDRKRILDYDFEANQKLIVLDEIHKHRQWRTIMPVRHT
jgi:predicted AAA+ superfamily ATPase